ncbi:hypothetical protein AB0F88_30410 [Streptosporangium sp. NPDC023963]|uniref:hypothetical protein n=1 Tax=Streptosporangium sp. NPDC023963 TaxID=3155608 RepID=UPI00342957A4
MAGSFRNPRFLSFIGDGPLIRQDKDRRIHVTVPAWAYRVTAPLVPRRGLDLFQRVVLGLCETGVRTPQGVSELTGLHARLCAYIIDTAKRDDLLDRGGEPTERGRVALRTGAVDEDTEWAVRYVFHDPATGDLWPRTAERLPDVYVVHREADDVVMDLGTAGRPAKVPALRMGADGERPGTPHPEQIMEVVRRDRMARINARSQEFARKHHLAALQDMEEEQTVYGGRVATGEPLAELARVALIGEPEPVEILGVIEAAGPDLPGEGWVAHDPFGVTTNAMFGRLVEHWATSRPELAERLDRLFKAQGEAVGADLKGATKRARAQAKAELVMEFGARVREDAGVLEKLVDLRTASYDGETDQALRMAVWAAFSLFEELFHRLTIAYPMPAHHAEPLRRRAAERRRRRRDGPDPLWTAPVAKETIRKAAERIGAFEVPYSVLNTGSDTLGELAGEPRPPDGTKIGVLIAATLISAEARDDHPMRRMIAHRSDVLFGYDQLRQMRNGQLHRLGRQSVAEDLKWCKELGEQAASELLELPPVS